MVRSPEEAAEAVRAHARLLPRGGATKPPLCAPPAGAAALDLRGLRGVVEYDPAEYTLTALAGTPLAEVQALLGRAGQYLPFDPPFAPGGATLGGTVAAGLSGPGRHRYGGVRDFVIGVRFVDGTGALVRGGGRVVKNAAGFDLPKLMVGSLGRLGVLVEVSLKVFPRPEATATVRLDRPALPEALDALVRLGRAPFDLEAVDLEPPGRLWLRLGGNASALGARIDRLRAFLGGGEVVPREEERLWDEAREFTWAPPDAALVKVPLTPLRIPPLEAALERQAAHPAAGNHPTGAAGTSPAAAPTRRYSAGGQVAWVAWPQDLETLHDLLAGLGLRGLVIRAPRPPARLLLGAPLEQAFLRRVKAALDPHGRFPEVA
ncbi:MAG: FAD-binding protein [Armatimonadota bacterium]|nr:FAD-binding protein [Armatimonadota bacterium]MDR7459409.1 FAD-binding protein [Armatimonadota bacterium]MDR7576611.1 FAD-binding protein [Armatimonadota bacterium]